VRGAAALAAADREAAPGAIALREIAARGVRDADGEAHQRDGERRGQRPPADPSDHSPSIADAVGAVKSPEVMFRPVPVPYSDEELDAAIDALSDPERFREAEAMIARAAPKLQRVLASALEQGGWFAESHDDATARAARTEDEAERLTAVRTLLADETRIGMLVGVAVGWALANELTKEDER
jgi:hypothetical protein